MFDKCPKCGKILKNGFLGSARMVYWTEEKPVVFGIPGDTGFNLPGGSQWNLSHYPAQYCPACGMLYVPTKEEDPS